MTQKVTKRQQAVLDCIEACIREKGYGPTVREVCQSLGLSSPSTVHVHLKALEDKGFIKRDLSKPRALEIIGNNNVSGDVAGGSLPCHGLRGRL